MVNRSIMKTRFRSHNTPVLVQSTIASYVNGTGLFWLEFVIAITKVSLS